MAKKNKDDWVEEYKGSFSERSMREHFRRYATQGASKFSLAISRIREKAHPARYNAALQALIQTAPKQITNLFAMGQRKFADLAQYNAPFSPIPLEHELVWTALWLSARTRQISEFRKVAREISELVGAENYEKSLDTLHQYRQNVGFTFWQVELEIGLVHLWQGNSAARTLVNSLRRSCSSGSIPGFIAYLVGERNDDALPYDTFYSRMKESIPRMSMEEWLKDYVLYRGLQHYDLTPSALAQNLRNERRSTIIDLYEAFIETCTTICTSHELRKYRTSVLTALVALEDIEDSRLWKIQLYAGGDWRPELACTGEESGTWSDLYPYLLYQGETTPSTAQSSFRQQLHADLAQVWNRGGGADRSVARLLKFGLCLKSIDIGIAIASHAERQSSKTGPLMLLAAGTPFCIEPITLEEVYGAPIDLSRQLLIQYATIELSSTEATRALAIERGDSQDVASLSELGKLWIANVSLANGNYALARLAVEELRKSGPRWIREATKHQFIDAYTRGDLETACSVLAQSLTNDSALSVELPITEMFSGRKWRDFSSLNPIQVGIAAHFAIDAPPASPVGFILSSACRSAIRFRKREILDGPLDEKMSEQEREELVLFFSDVWNENVLARTGAFETSHDVRLERLHVVRRLLDWDGRREDIYKAAIKSLTLDESLWQGVKQVNETRVFVNQPAISRWAEKELIDEYNRWLVIESVELPETEVTEEKVLDYLTAPMDSIVGSVQFDRVTEGNALFFNILSRLLNRFLTDPTDGLNCYLSVRVRHGSLLRALFGPSESIDILLADNEASATQLQKIQELSRTKWPDVTLVHHALASFSEKMRRIGDDLIRERVQIKDDAHPHGLFVAAQSYFSLSIERLIKTAKLGFEFFLESSYYIFWISLSDSLESARRYLSQDIKSEISELYSDLINVLQSVESIDANFLASVKQASTQTNAACDQTAGWFQLPNMRDALTFNLQQTIEVARQVSQTLNPGFEPQLRTTLPETELPLASVGLSTIVDCLLLILDNVWEHGEVGASPEIKISIELDDDILWLRSESPVKESIYRSLQTSGLNIIRDRLQQSDASGLVSKEGGSGLAKLKRLTRNVSTTNSERIVFDFGVHEERFEWYITLGMKLWKNEGGAYYAY